MNNKWRHELRWMRHVIARGDHEMRLDRWLRQQFPLVPQSLLQAQLRKRKVRLVAPAQLPSVEHSSLVPNKPPVTTLLVSVPGKASSVLLEGFTVSIDAHLFQHTLQHAVVSDTKQQQQVARANKPKPLPMLPELLQRIMYQDANYFVLDKPHGLAVQEGSGLETSLNDYLPAIARSFTRSAADTKPKADTNAPRLVHRLDKETSGLLVLARSRLAAARFTELLQSGQVHKTYQALVAVSPARKRAFETHLALFQGEITSPVDGKPATTLVKTLFGKAVEDPRGVWLELSPVTGRKHQLRVHCAQVLHAPIVGDTKYRGPKADRLYLHAQRIEFPDPFGSDDKEERRRRPGTKMIDIQRSIEHEYSTLKRPSPMDLK